jgi:hypothetical protein
MELLQKNRRKFIILFSISAIAAVFFLLWGAKTNTGNKHDLKFIACISVSFISLSLFTISEAFKPISGRFGRSNRFLSRIFMIPVTVAALYSIIAFIRLLI